jgi:hypothetical protein
VRELTFFFKAQESTAILTGLFLGYSFNNIFRASVALINTVAIDAVWKTSMQKEPRDRMSAADLLVNSSKL